MVPVSLTRLALLNSFIRRAFGQSLRLGPAIIALTTIPLVADDARLAEQAGWEALLNLQNREAVEYFAASTTRSSQLGEALALLNSQPQTRANFGRAEQLLTALHESNPHDESGIAATYYLGRLAQLNPFGPDYAKAARYLENLIEQHPSTPYAQMAITKLAILRIYLLPQESTREATLGELNNRLSPYLALPAAIRDFNLILADAYARFQISDEAALNHLLAAYHSGVLIGKARSDILLRIGELSRLLGDKDQAKRFYRQFLEEFPRDQRTHTIRERLEALS